MGGIGWVRSKYLTRSGLALMLGAMSEPMIDPPPYVLTRPDGCGPLVFSSPHSGRYYPPSLMRASRLDAQSIRLSEDAYVDELIACAPRQGISLICATYGRAYVDINRAANELDPGMFDEAFPPVQGAGAARIAAGLGTIAKIVAEGREIYDGKLSLAEAAGRINQVHQPFHQALSGLLDQAMAQHGHALLIDWHSMPSASIAKAGCDFVLGDRYGSACSPVLTRLVDQTLTGMGYAVARNVPYAGGYTTEHYGRPMDGVHALQIEINRGLYLDEAQIQPGLGFVGLQRAITRLIQVMGQTDWAMALGSGRRAIA